MKERLHNVVDLEIKEHINGWVKQRGIEGAEDLIYTATAHPQLAQLRNKTLNIFYRQFPFLIK